jgi:hypothetical protein
MAKNRLNLLIHNLLNTIAEKRGTAQWALEIGIPVDRVYGWRRNGTNPKSEDERIIMAWLTKQTPGKIDKAPGELSTSQDDAYEYGGNRKPSSESTGRSVPLDMEAHFIRNEAALTVVAVTLAKVVAQQTKEPTGDISDEILKAIDVETGKIYDKLGKKRPVGKP